jgi:hypothetical protein
MADGIERMRKYYIDTGPKLVPRDLQNEIDYIVEISGTDACDMAKYVDRITKNQFIHTSYAIRRFPEKKPSHQYLKTLHKFYIPEEARLAEEVLPEISDKTFMPENWVKRWEYLNQENFIPDLDPKQFGLEYYGRRDDEKKGLCLNYQALKLHEKLGGQCMVISDACVQNLRISWIPALLRVGRLESKIEHLNKMGIETKNGHHFVTSYETNNIFRVTDSSDNWKHVVRTREGREKWSKSMKFFTVEESFDSFYKEPETYVSGSGDAGGWRIICQIVLDDMACRIKTPRLKAWRDPISFVDPDTHEKIQLNKLDNPEEQSQKYYEGLYKNKIWPNVKDVYEIDTTIRKLSNKKMRRRIEERPFLEQLDVLYDEQLDHLEAIKKMRFIKIG